MSNSWPGLSRYGCWAACTRIKDQWSKTGIGSIFLSICNMPEILLVQVTYWWSVLCFFHNNFSVWGGLFSYVCLLSMGRLSPNRIDKNQTFCLPISTYILRDFLASRFCKTTRRFSPFSCFQHDMFVWKIICWITLLIDTPPHSATDIPPFSLSAFLPFIFFLCWFWFDNCDS